MATPMKPARSGASFLTTPMASDEVFAPEVFDDEQRMMADTARAFVHGEVMPLAERIEVQEPGLMRSLVQKAGTLGLLSADVPEEYGGLGAGVTVSAILADYLAGESSFGVAWGVHTTVCTLPNVYHGTPEQKASWLPRTRTRASLCACA